MTEPVIRGAVVAAGHDGQAQLVVRVKYENGAIASVTLDAERARRLMDNCGVERAEDLRGQPWQRFLDIEPKR